MSTPSLRSIFLVKEDIHHQHWTSDGTRYNVGALYQFAEAVTEPEEIPLESLRRGFEKTNLDEEKWSEDFVKRCQKANLDYPILVVQDNKDRLWIADGNHRYGKAVMHNEEFILGYIIHENEIPDKAIEPKPESDEDQE